MYGVALCDFELFDDVGDVHDCLKCIDGSVCMEGNKSLHVISVSNWRPLE